MVKFSIYRGDIIKLEVEAIVYESGCGLGTSRCIDGVIGAAAGPALFDKYMTLGGVPIGEAKITKGYNLPRKYIIHTSGPRNMALGLALSIAVNLACDFEMLAKCYISCLEVAKTHNIKEIAFPCISTGSLRMPKPNSAITAFDTVKKWLDKEEHNFKHIIFNVFTKEDHIIYQNIFTAAEVEYESLSLVA